MGADDIGSSAEGLGSQRVFKKSSASGRLTLYVGAREVFAGRNGGRLRGVLHLPDPSIMDARKLFAQLTLTFRYGREDEEVMGLKFCNEAVMSLAQVWPPLPGQTTDESTPLQEALVRRLGAHAYAFSLIVSPMAPPSVQLVPAKEYRGAPIGTSYDVRAYIADRADEYQHRRGVVRMGVRVVQTAPPIVPASLARLPSTKENRLFRFSPKALKAVKSSEDCQGVTGQVLDVPPNKETDVVSGTTGVEESSPALPAPHAAVEKPFLLSDGRVELEASLDKAVYSHGEDINVDVRIHNHSQKTVRRIKALVIQHVDVCMFSNGKFKNVVAEAGSAPGPGPEFPAPPGAVRRTQYTLRPQRNHCATKNWIALEDSYSKKGASLASTVVCNSDSPDDRNVFAIYVSYYVKVKLSLSSMGGEVSLKLPFTLVHACDSDECPTDDYSPKHTSALNAASSVDGGDDAEVTKNENRRSRLYKLIEQTEINSINELDTKLEIEKSPLDATILGLTNVIINVETKKEVTAQEKLKNVQDEKESDTPRNTELKVEIHPATSQKSRRSHEDMNLIVRYECEDT